MEFTVRKFDFLQELTLIQGVVERKTTIPILANVLVRAEADGLARPFTVRAALTARLASLDADARRVLEYVAIAGKPLSIELALQAAGVGPSGRLLVYSLCSDSLLRVTVQDGQDFLQTYHDRLREFAPAGRHGQGGRRRLQLGRPGECAGGGQG